MPLLLMVYSCDTDAISDPPVAGEMLAISSKLAQIDAGLNLYSKNNNFSPKSTLIINEAPSIEFISYKIQALEYLVERHFAMGTFANDDKLNQNQRLQFLSADTVSTDALEVAINMIAENISSVVKLPDINSINVVDNTGLATLNEQLNRIEDRLYGIKNVMRPSDVYQLALHVSALLVPNCVAFPDYPPLIMGKRPRDVYTQFHKMLEKLPQINKGREFKGGRIQPQEVFDLGIYTFVKTDQYLKTHNKIVNLNSIGYNLPMDSELITPSHVFQLMEGNMALFECMLNG